VSARPAQRPPVAPAPTERTRPLQAGGFPTLLDALDYAAGAGTGVSFHDGRGRLDQTLSWGELRDQAREAGTRLAALELPRGSRVGIVAETRPDFIAAFFACRFAALTPVPLPATVHTRQPHIMNSNINESSSSSCSSRALGASSTKPHTIEAGAHTLRWP
jgi:fatty-acyl-CoA synthase